MVRQLVVGVVALLVAGCAAKPVPAPTIAAAPPPVAAPLPALPAGATPGMLVPAALADGSYPTPNQRISAAATLWHLRSALNVAALACPADQGAAITAGYNVLLAAHRAELKAAEASYAAEYRASGGTDWRDGYDNAMTRLYNFFSQTPVRPGFCAAAGAVMVRLSAVPAGGLPAVAASELSALDLPFVDFYKAYDAWRTASAGSVARPVIAVSAVTPSAMVPPPMVPTRLVPTRPPAASPAPVVAKPVPAPLVTTVPASPTPPRLELDLSTLPAESPTGG